MSIRRPRHGGTGTAVPAGLVTGFVLTLVAAAVATAAPAGAVEDPTRPGARVTHGPSCRPGGLVVEVTAGTSPYFVRLASTRRPGGEDEATLSPGTTAVLRTDGVDWGETIDGRLEFSARDDSGVQYVDELEQYSFTRPTREDCEAITSPPPAAEPTPTSSTTPSGNRGSAPAHTGTTPGQPSAPTTSGRGTPGRDGTPASRTTDRADAPAHPVAPGDRVTLRVRGFLPGERVTIQLHDGGSVLGSATAAPDGTVEAEVRIPDRTAEGPATIDLVGGESAVVADVDLRVAAQETATDRGGVVSLLSLVAAAVALLATVAALVSEVGRRRGGHRGHRAARSA